MDVPDLEVPGARAQLATDCGTFDGYGTGVAAKGPAAAGVEKARAVTFTVTE